MLEKYLIDHCSPTLASLKTASLFRLRLNPKERERQLSEWNARLNGKGITLLALRTQEDEALIYVCRPTHLQADLQRPGVARFLAGYGYVHTDVGYALARLRERLSVCEDFPHEIGVFLGYPLGDVVGFIKNEGRNSKCTGCWKVYCNECEAMKMFAKFRKCKAVYSRLWNQGKPVWQLTVAA